MTSFRVLKADWVLTWFLGYIVFNFIASNSIIQYIGTLVLLVVFVIYPYYLIQKKSEERDISKFKSYIFLYYASLLALGQNILIFVFNAFISSTFNISGEITLTTNSLFTSVYSSLFLLDIAYLLGFFFYFSFTKPAEAKIQFKQIGQVAIVLFLFSSLYWRINSGWYSVTNYSDWLITEFNALSINRGFYLFSQVCFFTIWYAFYSLNKVDKDLSHGYLSGDLYSGKLLSYLRAFLLILIIKLCGDIIFIFDDLIIPFSVLMMIYLAFTTTLIPIMIILITLNIFQKYNLKI